MTADAVVKLKSICEKSRFFLYFMFGLETISAKLFNILHSAWKLFQPKCLIF